MLVRRLISVIRNNEWLELVLVALASTAVFFAILLLVFIPMVYLSKPEPVRLFTLTREQMMALELAISIAGGLVVAALVGALGFFIGKLKTQKRYERRNEAAISSFSDELQKAIFTQQDPQNPATTIAVARSVVSIRDGGQAGLSEFQKLLNSEIDTLNRLLLEVRVLEERNERVPQNLAKRVEETLAVLKLTWPAKKTQIDVAIRKVLAELGLDPLI